MSSYLLGRQNDFRREMTSVTAGLKFVRNLGNFQSVHIDIGVTDDVRDGENVNTAFERVYSFVEKKLLEKVDEVEAELGGK